MKCFNSQRTLVDVRGDAVLDKLEFMIALAREQHFGRAAESCGVAQPTFSLGIQSLEQSLGVTLVKRSSRFQGFTPEGERLLGWARRLVGDAKAMRNDMRGLNSGIDGHLRIAAVPFVMPVLARLTVPLQQRHPDLRLTVLGRTSDVLLNMLQQREIDAGITYLSNEPIGEVDAVPLYREDYFLLTSVTGPLSESETVPWSAVGGLPLCLFSREMQHRRIVDTILRGVGIEVTPLMETDSMPALIAHVGQGSWASIIPSSALETVNLSAGLRAVPLVEPSVSHTIGLVVSNRYQVQPALSALIAEARAQTPQNLLPAA